MELINTTSPNHVIRSNSSMLKTPNSVRGRGKCFTSITSVQAFAQLKLMPPNRPVKNVIAALVVLKRRIVNEIDY